MNYNKIVTKYSQQKEFYNEKDISNIVMDFYEGKDSFGGLQFVDSFWKKTSNNDNGILL